MKMSNLRKVKNASKVRYFNENSIGDHINKILTKHGENVFYGVNFVDQVKNASRVFKNICKHNHVRPEVKSNIFNPYSGKQSLVEDWIAFIHYELLMLFQIGHDWTEYDRMVLDSIKTALMLEYREVYYDYFD